MAKTKIVGLDDALDAMFPSDPEDPVDSETPKNEVVQKPKTKSKTGSSSKKTTGQNTKKPGKSEKPVDGKPKIRLKKRLKSKIYRRKTVLPVQTENEIPSVDVNNQDQNDDFFSIPKKERFVDTHTQENVWLHNDLLRDLQSIFQDKPKGFKTSFYNAALRYALKRYKETQE